MQNEAQREDGDETVGPDKETELFDPWQQAFSEELKRQQQEFDF
ncbi:hypothetical protein [Pseudorhizobium marinum]|nr:hypothetical protein [Pseudorhizobium marinum]